MRRLERALEPLLAWVERRAQDFIVWRVLRRLTDEDDGYPDTFA